MNEIASLTRGGGSDMFTVEKDIGSVSQEDFLKLLITQLQHQDPMEPQDSQQFASQLAQFTSLEELQNLNHTTTQGVEANLMLAQTINNTMAATMIGKEVKAIGNTIKLEQGSTPQLSFQTGGHADSVEITIRDVAGQIVDTISMADVTKGDHTIVWDGKNSDGQEIPSGNYTFSVNATNAAGEEIASDTVMMGLIEAVRYGSTGAIFIVNGEEIPFSKVLELGQYISEDLEQPEPDDQG